MFCCETCPDEEERNKITYNELSDKGGETVSDLCSDMKPVYIVNEDNSRLGKTAELKTAIEKTESLVSSRTASLVGLRRMMFENISHTDDEKLPKLKKLISDKSDNLDFKSSSVNVINDNEVKCDINSTVMDKVNKYNFRESVSGSEHQLSGSNVSSKIDFNNRRFSDISSNDKLSDTDSLQKEYAVTPPIANEISNKLSLENSNQIDELRSTVESEPILVSDQVDSTDVVDEGTVQVVNSEKADLYVNEFKDESGSESNSLVETKNHLVKTSTFEEKDSDIQHSSLVETKNDFVLAVTERQFGFKEDKELEPELSFDLNTKDEPPDSECSETKSKTSTLDFEEKDVNEESSVVEAKNNLVQVSLKQEIVLNKKQEIECKETSENTDKENQIESDSDSERFVPKPAPRREHRHKFEQGRQKSFTLPVPIVVVTKRENKKSNTLEYPDELNPFGNDDEEDDNENKKSTNPFGSSDDEDRLKEDSPKHVRKKIEVPKYQLNPFWSEGEESSEEEASHQGPPVPLPRFVPYI